MNIQPVLNEVRSYWIGGETGGQILLGGPEAHYNTERTIALVLDYVKYACHRPWYPPTLLWEIEAEERHNYQVSERVYTGLN